MADNTPRCVRGPYRQKRRTPRQTTHNRNCKRRAVGHGGNSETVNNSLQQDLSATESDATTSTTTTTTLLPSIPARTQHAKVFKDAFVTELSSELAIKTFSSRHHLTRQAQEDLLQLLQVHSPLDSHIPSSLFTLRKNSLLNPVCVQPMLHYMCPKCYTAIPEKHCTVCPNTNCGSSLSSLPSFFTISIAEQLGIILKSKIICG